MIFRFENFFRKWRRRLSRSEWAIHLLGLGVSKNTGNRPGLVLIQIDGLPRRQMELAMENGRLPFLRRLQQREHYALRTFYSGLPAGTPAVQGELFYGVRCAVPAFSFFDRSTQRLFRMFEWESAREIEERLSRDREGLLRGGSSWSNIYSGGADNDESHFCTSRLGFGDLFRSRPVRRWLTLPLFHLPSVLRLLLLSGFELLLALWDMVGGCLAGESFLKEFRFVFLRTLASIGLREAITLGVKIDIARGLPIIHVNYIGYDEQAHRRGPASAFAHWSLKGIDRAVKKIWHAAHRSGRREYQVWIFSDHGQESTRWFQSPDGRTLEQIVSDFSRRPSPPADSAVRPEPSAPAAPPAMESKPVPHSNSHSETIVAAMGPVGHLYLPGKPLEAQKRALATHLVQSAGLPGVLLRTDGGHIEWIDSQGRAIVPAEVAALLPHPPELRVELVRDLVEFCSQENAGDLILLGWGRDGTSYSFINERGAHAGLGPEETQGFFLAPAVTRLPPRPRTYVRAADVRAAALHFLERRYLAVGSRPARPPTTRLRVMTYNVHGCRGMDGRISPNRIARIIEQYDPDIVALQELDFGRVRSQRHDQPRLIAEALGMHVRFCPTVIDQDEQYGHALLSHHPMAMIRKEILGRNPQRRPTEPRGALWVRVDMDGRTLHVMNTHFGLGRRERASQARELLGPGWIGEVTQEERLIVCGDFNMFPGSVPHRALCRRLVDVQGESMPAQNTFSTLHPFARIDHIFVSSHFVARKVLVPRNELTRVASDHLPLIVDLIFPPAP